MRKEYDHKMHTDARYNILFINAVTIALFNLIFNDITMMITFKNLYNAIHLGHLKTHFEMHRGERVKGLYKNYITHPKGGVAAGVRKAFSI